MHGFTKRSSTPVLGWCCSTGATAIPFEPVTGPRPEQAADVAKTGLRQVEPELLVGVPDDGPDPARGTPAQRPVEQTVVGLDRALDRLTRRCRTLDRWASETANREAMTRADALCGQ